MECLIREYKLGQMFLLLQGITLDAAEQPRRVDCRAAVHGCWWWEGEGGGPVTLCAGGCRFMRLVVVCTCCVASVAAAGGAALVVASSGGSGGLSAGCSLHGWPGPGCWHTGTVSSRRPALATSTTVHQHHLPCPGDPRQPCSEARGQ